MRRIVRTAVSERNLLPKKCATDYYQLVLKNIMSQRYAGAYPAYHPSYAKWKEQAVSKMDYWRLFDNVIRNLRAFRVDGNEAGQVAYMGGIDDSASANGKSIALYGHAVEDGNFGAGKAKKPRPVFWPTALEYAIKPWRDRNYQSLNRIKGNWR